MWSSCDRQDDNDGLKKKKKRLFTIFGEKNHSRCGNCGSGDRISTSTKPLMHLQAGEKPLGFTSLQKLSFFPNWEKNYL